MLTLMGVGRDNTGSYPKTIHIGFILPSDLKVDAIYRRLKDDGVESPSQQHGAWALSFQAPGNVRIVVRSQEALPQADDPVGDQDAGSSRHSSARHEAKHRWRH